MRVVVNGEPMELPGGATVAEAAQAVGVHSGARGVAIAVDGEVIPRAMHEIVELGEGQRVEVVAAIQGGSV